MASANASHLMRQMTEPSGSDESLAKLREGNARFVAGKMSHKDFVKRRAELVSGQKPYAIILTCSDSRVAPEHIFDAGLGDIFVVRSAGNIVDAIGLGSLEYAAEHLGAPLLVVMGHASCGAVNAACASPSAPGNIDAVVKEIQEAVKLGGKDQAATVGENVKCVLKKIRSKSSILTHLEKEGRLKIVGAIYSLQTGKAEFLA